MLLSGRNHMPSFLDKYIDEKVTCEELEQQADRVLETNDPTPLDLTASEFELFERLGKDALDKIIEARKQKREIIAKWKTFFREVIAVNHMKNTTKLKNINEFDLNPFLDTYKANFLMGDSSAESKATALVYARALGTSINTSFGTNLQKFCSEILSGYASTTSGIDIEYVDFIDGKRKYCQIKAGPNTINKDDVQTIKGHFTGVRNLARTNNIDVGFNDLVVGVFYGTEADLSSHYKKIMEEYPVHIGQDFWFRLTGDETFYSALTKAVEEVAEEYDGREILEETIDALASEIQEVGD